VVPATNEDEDLTAAEVSEAILKAKFAVSTFKAEYYDWIWWGVICGTSFMKSWWDPNAPDHDYLTLPKPPVNPQTGEAIPLEWFESKPELKKYYETPIPARGKICDEAVNPFYVFVPNLLTRDIEKQPFVIEVRTQDPQWVEDTFHFKPSCDARAQQTIMEGATLISKGSENVFDAVLVKEVWIKPHTHPDFPRGGMMTIINSKVVKLEREWPLPFPEYPYYKYEGVPTGGFYGDSIVVDLLPVQKEYNRKRSQAIEITNVMGKPRFFYPQGSIDPRKMSSEPGQAVGYKSGFAPPVPMPGLEVPQSMVNEVQQLRTEFDDIAGQHGISNGETPAGVTSGTAIAYLNEQDESSLSSQVSGIENAMEKLGTHYLKYVVEYWQDDRVIRIAGKNNAYESIHWKKSAAQGNTDVRVQTGSALPHSKAAKQALIMEMMQNGFLLPEVGMEFLDFGMFEKAMEEYLVDKRQCTREHLKLMDAPDKMLEMLMTPPADEFGQPMQDEQGRTLQPDGTPFQPQPPIPVNSWDNHEAHIKWHDLFRKTNEFEMLSQIKKKAMELHVQGHKMAQMVAQVNLQGTMLQPGMDGAMGGPPPVGGAPMGPPPPGGPQASGGPNSQTTEQMGDNQNRLQAADARQNQGMFADR
jgi:hypothetical protein